jgi:WD40 repeat protein
MENPEEDQQVILDEGEESFINEGEAVEVKVDDDDMPMEEDDDDKDEATPDASSIDVQDIPDLSIQKISSHSSSVYAVASHHDQATNTLSIITGAGDDRAFLHKLDNNNAVTTIPLSHAHTDSVSSVASNEKFISSDLSKTPKYLAVGAYDGSVVLYNPENGEKIKVLDGPTDVEFVSFHPKGGSVSFYKRFS